MIDPDKAAIDQSGFARGWLGKNAPTYGTVYTAIGLNGKALVSSIVVSAKVDEVTILDRIAVATK